MKSNGTLCLKFMSIAAAVLILAPANGRAGDSNESDLKKATAQAVSIIRGEAIYNNACAGCHGRTGDGYCVSGPYLDPKPRDLTKGVYRFRSTPAGELPTDEDIYRVTAEGVQGTMMPGFKGMLSESEIRNVVIYTKSLSEAFNDYPQGESISIPPEIPMTEETVDEGRQVYMVLGCWTCHGTSGAGDGPSAGVQKDNDGNKLSVQDFVYGPYKMGRDSRSLYLTINTGLDGTGMASYQDLFAFSNNVDMDRYKADYTATEIEALRVYLRVQPTNEDVNNMDEASKEEIATRRKWSLVHYVQSFYKKRGWVWRLFGEDTEVTGAL